MSRPTFVASGCSETTAPFCGVRQSASFWSWVFPPQAETSRKATAADRDAARKGPTPSAVFGVGDLLDLDAALLQVGDGGLDRRLVAFDLDRDEGHRVRDARRADVGHDAELRPQRVGDDRLG